MVQTDADQRRCRTIHPRVGAGGGSAAGEYRTKVVQQANTYQRGAHDTEPNYRNGNCPEVVHGDTGQRRCRQDTGQRRCSEIKTRGGGGGYRLMVVQADTVQ
jgi:hypothetical protein